MAKSEAIDFTELIDMFKYQGVVTLKQACEFLPGYPENTVRDTLNRYCASSARFGNALFSKKRARRPWINSKDNNAGASESMYSLEKDGAAQLLELTGIRKDPPDDPKKKNIMHALALVDIAATCVKGHFECKINRQVNYTGKDGNNEELQKYARPDVQFSDPISNKITFIEFEQSRVQADLFHMVLERMARWEEIFVGPDANKFSNEIVILFWLKKKDDFTIETWMRALSEFEKSTGHAPHYQIYQREFRDFIKHPDFDLQKGEYKRIEASEDPKQMLKQIENRERILQTAEQICSNLDETLSTLTIESFAKDSQPLFEALQNASNRQTFFINQVQMLYLISHSTERTGYAEASKPWAGILLIQKWLEQEQLARLRLSLTESITAIYALSKKNQPSAAMAYEQMVWDVLLRYFNFASGGPLHFRVVTGSADSEDRVYDLVPDTQISFPWNGVFENKSEADKCKEAIDWFITMVVRYQQEIGLTRNKRSAQTHQTRGNTSEIER